MNYKLYFCSCIIHGTRTRGYGANPGGLLVYIGFDLYECIWGFQMAKFRIHFAY